MSGDTSRIGAKRQIGSRNPGKDARTQVWDTILKREAAAMGHIHVCDACVAPCEIRSQEGSGSFAMGEEALVLPVVDLDETMEEVWSNGRDLMSRSICGFIRMC